MRSMGTLWISASASPSASKMRIAVAFAVLLIAAFSMMCANFRQAAAVLVVCCVGTVLVMMGMAMRMSRAHDRGCS